MPRSCVVIARFSSITMTNFPSLQHWHYLHGRPTGTAQLKASPEDFQVSETLPFALADEGEHLYLYIQKTGLNTGFLAQQIADFYGVRERDISYAGRKDKHAVTKQWFSVWLPGKSAQNLPAFTYRDCQLLETRWHNKKLRTGSIQHNHFVITLRNVHSDDNLEERVALIKAQDVL